MSDIKGGQIFYEVVSKLEPSFNSNIKKAETNVKSLEKEIKKTSQTTETLGDKLKGFAQAAGLAFIATAVVNFGRASVQAFAAAQQSLIQFNNAQENVVGSTKEQIESLNEYIMLLEQKTTVDDKSIRQGAQILAQDQISIENQKKLLAGLIDLSVANAKVGGGEVDVTGTAKAIGRAIATGDLGALTRQNIVGIDESRIELFKLGDQATRTAIAVDLLRENGEGAAEAYGASFQGKINRANDALEDLQVTVGSGLSISFKNLVSNLITTKTSTEEVTSEVSTFGVNMIRASGVVSIVILGLKNLYELLKVIVLGVGKLSLGLASFNIDAIKSLKNLGNTLSSVSESVTRLIKGDFAGAKEALKDAFSTIEISDRTKNIFKDIKDDLANFSEAARNSREQFANTTRSLFNATAVYTELKAEQDSLTEATNSLKKAQEDQARATALTEKEAEKAKQQVESFTNKLVTLTEESKKTSKELNENLKKAYEDLSKSISGSLDETQNKLASIVLSAEETKNRILAQTDRTEEDQKALAEAERILNARVGFEERSAKQIQELRDKLNQAGLDGNLLSIDPNQKTLEQEIQQQRINASLDEFTLFEQQQNAKLLKITNDFITETLLLTNKIDKQKSLEADLTEFLTSENQKRIIDIELFAAKSISKYGEIASSLRELISLQNRVGAISTAGQGQQQFHEGGYVGALGGQVHAGEFVVPSKLVASNPELIAMLDRARSQTNNITINANGGVGDIRSANEELLWRLGRI